MNHWTWRKITQSPVFNLTNRKHLKNENNSSDLGVYAKPLNRPSTFQYDLPDASPRLESYGYTDDHLKLTAQNEVVQVNEAGKFDEWCPEKHMTTNTIKRKLLKLRKIHQRN